MRVNVVLRFVVVFAAAGRCEDCCERFLWLLLVLVGVGVGLGGAMGRAIIMTDLDDRDDGVASPLLIFSSISFGRPLVEAVVDADAAAAAAPPLECHWCH